MERNRFVYGSSNNNQEGQIRKTHNGFTFINNKTFNSHINDASMPFPNWIMMVGDNGEAQYSPDGGVNWNTPVNLPNTNKDFCNNMIGINHT